jgi:hypothetical protein
MVKETIVLKIFMKSGYLYIYIYIYIYIYMMMMMMMMLSNFSGWTRMKMVLSVRKKLMR